MDKDPQSYSNFEEFYPTFASYDMFVNFATKTLQSSVNYTFQCRKNTTTISLDTIFITISNVVDTSTRKKLAFELITEPTS